MTEPTVTTTDALAEYLRVSSDEQRKQGTIENQRALLDRYTAAHGIMPYGTYEDDGVTGTLLFAGRPSGARLLADVRAGLVTTVLITKLDRFGRNAREILNAVHELNTAGAQLVSLKENVDTRTIAGRFFLTVLAGVAEMERDMILEKTAEGNARRLESTTWMGGYAPYGYRREGKRRDAHLVIEDTIDASSGYSEADVARLIWHLLLDRNWSCKRIAAYLSGDLGIPTREEVNPWTPATVYNMLTNRIYMGEREYRKQDGTVIVQSAPALITAEQWERGQQLLEQHRKTSTCNPTRPYLLRGLMHCKLCGALYTTTWRRVHGGEPGAIHRLYICSNHHYKAQHSRKRPGSALPSDCAGMWVDADWVEQKVWGDVERFVRNPGPTLVELAARSGEQTTAAETYRAALADVTQALDAQQRERDAINARYRKGRMSERDLDHQLDDIAREEAVHLRTRESLLADVAEATDTTTRLEAARTVLQHLHALLGEGEGAVTPHTQRTAVETLVKSIVVETVEVPGKVDRRGRPARKARVHPTYHFEKAVSAHTELHALLPVSRRRP